MGQQLNEYCHRYEKNELLAQWHPQKNGGITPTDVTVGSHRKIWWRCDHGHEWEAPVYARVSGNGGCPYCSGKRIAPGKDLESLYPDIALQWHPTRNGSSSPAQYLPGSHKSAWWRCDRGHEWKALIKSRVEGRGCPVCANKVVIPGQNDLAAAAPELAAQWHPEKNGSLKPDQVLFGSTRTVWWRCERGHEWQAEIQSRFSGKGCPVCAGRVILPGENDLETEAPQIAAQWDAEKNGALKPSQIAAYSNKSVWWRCRKEHSWKATVYSRTFGGSDCPYCSGKRVLPGFNDLKTLEPKVAEQWHPTRNLPLEPDMVMPGCRKKVWWKCSIGHEWKAVVYSRTGKQMCGCPECAGRAPRTYAEP